MSPRSTPTVLSVVALALLGMLGLLGVLGLGGCSAPDPGSASEGVATEAMGASPLHVYAAASLADVVEILVRDFDAPASTSFGSSSALARQVRDGAPADIFLSASPQWIDFLREAGALDSEPRVLARNRLVAIAPLGHGLHGTGRPLDPRSLLERLAPDDAIAIADQGVPAGEYARAALDSLGLLDAYRPRLVGQSDVRAVLLAVERGQLPAGFVYATDAAVAEVEVLFTFDGASHPPIEYQAAIPTSAESPEAAHAFLEYLGSETARARLADAGFDLP